MIQSLLWSHIVQIRRRRIAKRPAGGRQNQFHGFVATPGSQALMGAVVFAVDRDYRRSVFPGCLHHNFTAGHQNLFICQSYGFSAADRFIRRLKTGDSDDRR